MPVYLLLMYLALMVISRSNLIGPAATQVGGASTAANWAFPFIVMAINFTIVIFVLNLPLVIGIGMSGHMGDAIKKFGAENIWKNVGTWTRRNTLGRVSDSAKWAGGK